MPHGAGKARIIAGTFDGVRGPAKTFTPINVWDIHLARDAEVALDVPEGHTAIVVVLTGRVAVNGNENLSDTEMVLLDRKGSMIDIHASDDAMLLVLTGEPIDEPIVGCGPFVMNSEAEIRQAVEDFNSGRFGQMTA